MKKHVIILLAGITWNLVAQAQVEYKPKQAETIPATEQAKPTPQKKVRVEPPKEHILKINLLSPIVSTLMLFYQHNLDKDKSFQLGCGYMDFYGFKSTQDESYPNSKQDFRENTKSFFFTPEFRYMLKGEYMGGTFIAPFLKYTYMQYNESYKQYNYQSGSTSLTSVSDTYTYNSLGLGVTIGQQLLYKNKVSIDFYAGPVYNMLLASSGNTSSSDIKISGTFNNSNVRGYGIRAGLTVGFMF